MFIMGFEIDSTKFPGEKTAPKVDDEKFKPSTLSPQSKGVGESQIVLSRID